MHQHIGKNIRLFRIKYDISMDEVVAATGLTRDTLYKVERGVLFGKSFVRYVLFLKERNADLNQLFDVDTKELLN